MKIITIVTIVSFLMQYWIIRNSSAIINTESDRV